MLWLAWVCLSSLTTPSPHPQRISARHISNNHSINVGLISVTMAHHWADVLCYWICYWFCESFLGHYTVIWDGHPVIIEKLFNWIFQPHEIVSHWRDPQLQVSEIIQIWQNRGQTILKSYLADWFHVVQKLVFNVMWKKTNIKVNKNVWNICLKYNNWNEGLLWCIIPHSFHFFLILRVFHKCGEVA